MRTLLGLIATVLAFFGGAITTKAQEPVVQIEFGTHRGLINRVVALDEQRFLTISDDQTSRVWSSGGKLLETIRGRTGDRDQGAVYAAAVSRRYIALGGRATDEPSGTTFVRFLDRATLKPAGVLAGLPNAVTALAFSPDESSLAVGFNSGSVWVFKLGDAEPIGKHDTEGASVNDLAFEIDGRLIVSSDRIEVLSADLKTVRRIALPADFAPWRVSRSADGKRFAVGSRSSPRAAIVSTQTGEVRLCSLATADGATPSVAWHRLGVIIVGYGGSGGALGVCTDGQSKAQGIHAGDVPLTALGIIGSRVLLADADGGWSEWNGEGSPVKRSSPAKLSFRRIGVAPLNVSADGMKVEISHNGLPFGILDVGAREFRPPSSLSSSPRPEPLASTNWDLDEAERILSSAAISGSDDSIIGTNFYLRRIDKMGRTVWKTSTPAPIWGVAVAEERGIVVAASGDGALLWSRLENGERMLTAVVFPDRAWAAWTSDGFFDRGENGAERIGYVVDGGAREGSRYVAMGRTAERYFRPDLTVAALNRRTGDLETLKDQTKKLGAAAAAVATNPPPIVTVEELCGVDRVTLSSIACFTGESIANVLKEQQLVFAEQIDVTIAVNSTAKLGPTHVRVNGIVTAPEDETVGGLDSIERRRIRIGLPPGTSEVSLAVATRDGSALSDPVTLTIARQNAPQLDRPPALLVTAIGIADYQLTMFDLASGGATKDAEQLSGLLTSDSNSVFARKSAAVLTDSRATRSAIARAFMQLAEIAQPEDVVVIFLSGHGAQIDGNYYFAPYEMGRSSLERATGNVKSGAQFPSEVINDFFRTDGISQSEIAAAMAKIRAQRVVLVIDTCFGGAFDRLELRQREGLSASVSARLSDISGRYIIASARGLALDNPDVAGSGTSIFTTAVLDAFGGAADRDSDAAVTLSELGDFVRIEVPKRAASAGVTQNPVISFFGDPYFKVFGRKEQ